MPRPCVGRRHECGASSGSIRAARQLERSCQHRNNCGCRHRRCQVSRELWVLPRVERAVRCRRAGRLRSEVRNLNGPSAADRANSNSDRREPAQPVAPTTHSRGDREVCDRGYEWEENCCREKQGVPRRQGSGAFRGGDLDVRDSRYERQENLCSSDRWKRTGSAARPRGKSSHWQP
jgi:hypothetical protein